MARNLRHHQVEIDSRSAEFYTIIPLFLLVCLRDRWCLNESKVNSAVVNTSYSHIQHKPRLNKFLFCYRFVLNCRSFMFTQEHRFHFVLCCQYLSPVSGDVNLLTPNVNYSGRTAPLTSKVAFHICIQQI